MIAAAPAASLGTYVISMAGAPSDVLAVHPKLKLALEQRDDAVKTAAAVNAQFEAISRQRDELLAAAKAAVQCIGEMGPSKPRVEVFLMLQDAIAYRTTWVDAKEMIARHPEMKAVPAAL